MMAHKEPPKLLSQQGYVNINYHYHNHGWVLFKRNNDISKPAKAIYQTFLEMWNDFRFPQVLQFNREDLSGRGCTYPSGTHTRVMNELVSLGLIKDYVPGSRHGGQMEGKKSVLKMVSLEGYYQANKNPYQNTVASFQEMPGGIEELKAIPEGDPRYPFAQSLLDSMKKQPVTPEKPQPPNIPVSNFQGSTPKVEIKSILSENDVMDLAQNLANKAKELYREVHKINPQIAIETGLKPEQEMMVSIDIVAYIAQKAGTTNPTEVQALLDKKMGEGINEEEMTFVARLVEERFVTHAAAKHGKDKEDIEGINASFKQGQEVRDKCYLQMAEVFIKEFKITRWCELYWMINKVNRLFFAAAQDPKLKADKMNPHAFAAWGKLFDYLKKDKGKKRKDFEKD